MDKEVDEIDLSQKGSFVRGKNKGTKDSVAAAKARNERLQRVKKSRKNVPLSRNRQSPIHDTIKGANVAGKYDIGKRKKKDNDVF